ncbi:hypothetical protein [Microvirga sp. TS319]|uniref:AbiU2 domain-containing protein n=1 Tax=Microvirga sp. TS319 TaxID=3241165 RepID=UPI00351A739B
MKKAPPKKSAASKLAELEAQAEILHGYVVNLVRSLGVFHGLNERLQGKSLSGKGASAIATILFDELHLIAIRINALIVEPKWADDVTIGTFVAALEDEKIKQLLIDRASEWHGPSRAATNRKQMTARIDQIRSRYDKLNTIGAKTLRDVRNKSLAHISTKGALIPPVTLRSLWSLGERTISLGSEVALIFREIDTGYSEEIRHLKEEARAIIGYTRAGIAAENRKVARARAARRSRKSAP